MSELREQLEYAVGELERIAESPTEVATVVEVNGHYVLASTGRESFSIKKPSSPMKIGDRVLLNSQSHQYIEHSPFATRPSIMTHVQDVIDDHAVIELGGQKKLVPVTVPTKAGDRVLLDELGTVVLKVMPEPELTKLDTGVTWDDIGGNEEAKKALQRVIENPYKHADMYEFYGCKSTSGILLAGPPGCGKTMLAKAAATSIGSSEGFISCKGPEVLDAFVGVAEATVRGLFASARKYYQRTGRRAVIFVDEAEAILGDRNARHAYMEKTIVPTFLTEMDGIDAASATVILSTNRSMNLDSAVVRDGRIDTKVLVSRPNSDDCAEIYVKHLSRSPVVGDVRELAEKATTAMWGISFENGGERHELSEVVSGSLIGGIVEKARMSAMERDIANGTRTGITVRDIGTALVMAVNELSLVALDKHYN